MKTIAYVCGTIFLLLAALIVVAEIDIGEYGTVRRAKQIVTHSMKDPNSTLFKNIFYKPGVVCGEVNSKNSFGAYIGYKPFIVIGDKLFTDDFMVSGLWTEACK